MSDQMSRRTFAGDPGSDRILEIRLEELEKRLDLRFVSEKEAREIAKQEIDRRLEGMNEFRTQLTKQATEFATKVQVEADRDRLSEVTAEKEKALEQRLDAREARLVVIERFKANWEGRFWMLVFLIGAVEVAMRVFWK